MIHEVVTIDPQKVTTAQMHGYLLGAVAPRPIAFVSTIDSQGNVNLSPYSFFNCFSANPPILVFSPARRVRDNTTKHTLDNAMATKEVVVNIVSYDIVEQMSLASTEYDQGVDEYTKAGFTPVPSVKVAPPRVGESPAAFECVVKDVISLGDQGGAGHLVVCEVVLAHIGSHVLDGSGAIDPQLIDAVARMGGNWYSRASGDALFEIPKPIRSKGIGVDLMPEKIRNSTVLSGNDLGRLGNIEALPTPQQVGETKEIPEVKALLHDDTEITEEQVGALHVMAKQYLQKGDTDTAWKILMLTA